jgi:hypothetical protein
MSLSFVSAGSGDERIRFARLSLGRARHNGSVSRDEEQATRNEIVFRDANEKIADRRAELDKVEGPTPFLCECEDPACTALLRLAEDDYTRVRSDATQFVIVPGHPTSGTATDLSGEGWVCVRKHGRAAELARQADPR